MGIIYNECRWRERLHQTARPTAGEGGQGGVKRSVDSTIFLLIGLQSTIKI